MKVIIKIDKKYAEVEIDDELIDLYAEDGINQELAKSIYISRELQPFIFSILTMKDKDK